MTKPLLKLCILLLALSMLPACSIGYQSRWKEEALSMKTQEPASLEGAWEGTWKSIKSGHQGKLKAIVERRAAGQDAPGTTYAFTYRATWGSLLSGVFKAEHLATPSKTNKGTLELSGQKDLGRLGGVYSFTGTATPSTFHADYTSSLDHGVFELKRPARP